MDLMTLPFLMMFALIGYLLGSIPFGLILTHLAGHGDIRNIGSGNIGATNVLRTGNKLLALATFLLDMGKGATAIWIARDFALTLEPPYLAALGAVLGHLFPAWLNFKGGKGVAVALGALLVLSPVTALAAMLTWLFVALTLRISSLAALTAFALAPLYAYFFGNFILWVTVLIITVLVFERHKENIRRLIAGTEPKIGKK